MASVDQAFADLDPDVFIARIPLHLMIGLEDPRTKECYILRRPGLQ